MSHKEAFESFHADNPEVYDNLLQLVGMLKLRGHKAYSIKGLFEVLRFRHALKTTAIDFKLNNNYTPYYSRMIMEHNPEHAGFFKTRDRQKDDGPSYQERYPSQVEYVDFSEGRGK